MVEKQFTIKELAETLGVHYITALNYVRRGRLKAIKIGGQWRVLESELERFMTEGNLTNFEGSSEIHDD